MNLWLRILYLLLTSPWKSRLAVLETSHLEMRVWPTDLDLNLHMNNGRYLTLMDLGRTDLIMRSGKLLAILRRGWRPVLGSATIQFKRPLAPGQRFRLETRIVGWDEKWFVLEQSFWAGDTLAAQAQVKALFLSNRGSVPSAQVLELLDHRQPSPAFSEL